MTDKLVDLVLELLEDCDRAGDTDRAIAVASSLHYLADAAVLVARAIAHREGGNMKSARLATEESQIVVGLARRANNKPTKQ